MLNSDELLNRDTRACVDLTICHLLEHALNTLQRNAFLQAYQFRLIYKKNVLSLSLVTLSNQLCSKPLKGTVPPKM